MTSIPVNNQRRFERFNISIKIEVIYPDGGAHICDTRDVSDGGIFVCMQRSHYPALGEVVAIKVIDKRDDAAHLMSESAVVVHRGDDGIGLAFIDMELK